MACFLELTWPQFTFLQEFPIELRHSTKHGLDWTGQLDWTGLILIYIFEWFAPQSFHSRKFYVQIFTGNTVWLAICFKMGSWYMGSNPMYIFY